VIRISISTAAFEAIASTLPLGSVAFEPQATANGARFIWLPDHVPTKPRPSAVAARTIAK
jgi:hypothetical protein